MKIDVNCIKNMRILNIGTGREAVAFANSGAKKIDHFDYSIQNVERLKTFIQNNNLNEIIVTKNVDIVDYELPSIYYDLIYTHGVIQHFSHPGKGLKNLINSMNEKGIIWLYFYRSGTFQNFCIELIRDLIENTKNSDLYYVASSLICSDKPSNLYISGFMDSCFAEYCNFFTPESYISYIKKCGLEIISSSKLDPINTDIDHKYAHPSTILIGRREKISDLHLDIDILSHKQSINQLDEDIYSNYVYHKLLTSLIKQYNQVKQLLNENTKNDIIIFLLAYRIYEIERDAYEDYLAKNCYDLDKYYSLLKSTFIDLVAKLKKKS